METPKHFYIFIVGDPKGGPFISMGHAVLDLEEETTTGMFTLVANDQSWVVHAKLADGYDYDEEAGIFTSELEVTNVKGTPPFPSVVPFGPFPIDTLHKSVTTPNLFIFVTANPPPLAPAAKKNK